MSKATRAEARRIITETLYGAPGEDYDTPDGRELMTALLEQMGLLALTDDAVVRLAAMHRDRDERQTRAAERKWADERKCRGEAGRG